VQREADGGTAAHITKRVEDDADEVPHFPGPPARDPSSSASGHTWHSDSLAIGRRPRDAFGNVVGKGAAQNEPAEHEAS
jgi:hypothetical protein